MEKLKIAFKFVVIYGLLGFIVMLGMRAADYFVAAPTTRLIICLAKDLPNIEVCKNLSDFKEYK